MSQSRVDKRQIIAYCAFGQNLFVRARGRRKNEPATGRLFNRLIDLLRNLFRFEADQIIVLDVADEHHIVQSFARLSDGTVACWT